MILSQATAKALGLLVAGNAVFGATIWQVATASWPPLEPTAPVLTPASVPMAALRPWRAVEREIGVVTTRMFGDQEAQLAVATKSEQPAGALAEETLRLIGVISDVDDERQSVALITCGAEGRLVRVRSGSTLPATGWTIGRIMSGGVEITKGGETHMLKLN